MVKNLLDINVNSSVEPGTQSLKACSPCLTECEKVNKIINKRKLSEIKKNEVAHILNVFDKKD
jgi:hypothetical protein